MLRLGRAREHQLCDVHGMAAMTGLTPATTACAARLIVNRILRPCAEPERRQVLEAMGLAAPLTSPCGMYASIPTSLESYCDQARPEQFELLTAMLMEHMNQILPAESVVRITEKSEV